MKKFIAIAIALSLVALIASCGGCGTGRFKDGIYTTEAPEFSQSGWKGVVSITVKGGKIVAADWDGVSLNTNQFKKQASIDGKYVMKEGGVPWHEQAALAEAYLIKTQDPTKIVYKDEDGHTDAISGASISVKEFFELAAQALLGIPMKAEAIVYKNGMYRAQAEGFDPKTGWRDYVEVYVKSGRIVYINWNGYTATGADKKSAVKNGKYDMGGAKNWTEQSIAVASYIVSTQDPSTIAYKDEEGHTDAISGATISVKTCFDLAAQALAMAK